MWFNEEKNMNLITGKREREISDPAHDSWQSIHCRFEDCDSSNYFLLRNVQEYHLYSFMANELDQLWNMLVSTCFNYVLLNPQKIESWSQKNMKMHQQNRLRTAFNFPQKNAIRTYHKKGALFFPQKRVCLKIGYPLNPTFHHNFPYEMVLTWGYHHVQTNPCP